MRQKYLLLTLLLGAAVVGCGQDEALSLPIPGVNVEKETYLLAAEPAGARNVMEVRQEAADGSEVIVVGRIAGGQKPLVAGRAAFTIVDLSLEPCTDEAPWVYCCTPREELIRAMVLVKFVDEHGRTLEQDARQLLGVKEWNTVVVHGRAQCDETGQLQAIVADRIYVRP